MDHTIVPVFVYTRAQSVAGRSANRVSDARFMNRQGALVAEAIAKSTLRERGVHELREFATIAVYLYVTIGALILLKAAVLHTQGVSFTPWGVAVVKAAVLAKFVLIGDAIRLGEGFKTGPLIWPTLYKSFSFLVLLVVLTIIEEIVIGLFHQRPVAASLQELFGSKLYETLAGYIVMLLILIPFFAFRELGEVLGRGTLGRLFFSDRGAAKPQ